MIFVMSIVDGMIFGVEESVAFESPIIRLKVEFLHSNTVAVPIHSYLLPRIIDYMRRHFNPNADGAPAAAGQDVSEILEAMDAEFMELLHMDFDRVILVSPSFFFFFYCNGRTRFERTRMGLRK
ncbi:SKP1/BTB/POZ domain superfamily [Abeliophyllum distichum]|uniref:SKP1/BTB/POZ domain superfamily n=1 Tax=Abeliophyllum distichum TaxID=126358 RepID=A0ABD1P7X4_9LAMI